MNLTPKKQTSVMLDVDMFFNRIDFNDLAIEGNEESFTERKCQQISQAVEKWQYVTGHTGYSIGIHQVMPDPPTGQIYIKYDLELQFYTIDFPELSDHDKVDSFASRKRDQIVQAVTKWQYVTGHASFGISVVGGIVQHQNSDDDFYVTDEQVRCNDSHPDANFSSLTSEQVAELVPVDVIKEAFGTNDADDSNEVKLASIVVRFTHAHPTRQKSRVTGIA